ncbi:DUF4241 domain-containing protein [Kitasatospora sp. NPDC096147]|uniref:DUF4241 domain-containing protein n=1 Tax=Kitasatospora sp. NPDC096147 TaxID=3364093 RepID=UPI0037FF4EAB
MSRTRGRALSVGQARERDAAGLPYVVLFGEPGSGRPVEVRLVSWGEGFVERWAYDDQGHPVLKAEQRLLADEGRLLNRRVISWHPQDRVAAESAQDRPRTVVDISPDGTGRISHQPEGMRGASLEAVLTVSDDQMWSARAEFGTWPLPSAEHLPGWVREHLERAGTPDASLPWCEEPSRMLLSVDLGALFRPGTRMSEPYGEEGEEMVVVEPERAGTLHVPSGLLAVDCPWGSGGPHFSIAIPAGTHVLDEAQADGSDGRASVTAFRVRTGEAPAVSWEMALRPCDDTWMLKKGQAYGFGTDGAAGAFADADRWDSLQELIRHAGEGRNSEAGEYEPDSASFLRAREPGSGAELAAFPLASDGVHPVWVGRSAEGDVVGVVVLVEGMPDLIAS